MYLSGVDFIMNFAKFKFTGTFNYSWQSTPFQGDFSIKGGNMFVSCGRGCLPIEGEIYLGVLDVKTTD